MLGFINGKRKGECMFYLKGKIKFLLSIALMLIIIKNPVFASDYVSVVEGVDVYINGKHFQTEEPFYNAHWRIVAPMRELFEELGADVTWDESTRTVVAKAKGKRIDIEIDSKLTKVDGKVVDLSVEPQIINSRTYVPLRFVAESFDYEVDWNGKDDVVSIFDMALIDSDEKNTVYQSSKTFKEQYVEMEIVDGKKLKVNGEIDKDKTKWLFKVERISDAQGNKRKNIVIEKYLSLSNGKFKHTFRLKNSLKTGKYEISLYFKNRGEELYHAFYYDIHLVKTDDDIYFPQSPVYANNYFKHLSASFAKPENYLNTFLYREADTLKIKKLAEKIVGDEEDDYQKLKKINDWVASNIYYDLDSYYSGKMVCTDAISTLENKMSVCQGYAELTNELLCAVGVPSRVVKGYALGLSTDGRYWDEVNHSDTNHAWNEVYVDGRWVIVDTTWNSRNDYKNGEFKKGDINNRYFDPDLKAFSADHKIISYGR